MKRPDQIIRQSLLWSCVGLNFFKKDCDNLWLNFKLDLSNWNRRFKLASGHDVKSYLSESVQEGYNVLGKVFTFEKYFADECKECLGSDG